MKSLRYIIVTVIRFFILVEVLVSLFYILPLVAMDQHSIYHPCDCSPVQVHGIERATVSNKAPATQKKNKLGPTFLLILVPILPAAIGSRDLIRGTWYKGFRDSEDVMLRFMMGVNGLDQSQINQLHKENTTHEDIVFLDNFTEGVQALTNKTIAMMKWASDNVDFTYLMKCDDDTFVYVNNAINELKRRPTTTNLYYGRIEFYSPVVKDRKSKQADPDWDLGNTYLPYALGGGYILSSDLVIMLAEQADYLKWHPKEDTAVGSWLAPYEYERRSDELCCVTDSSGVLKGNCVKSFPLLHIFYGYPAPHNQTTYFHLLHNEYLTAKKETQH